MTWQSAVHSLPHAFRGTFLGSVAAALNLDVKTVVEVGVGAGENAMALRASFPTAKLTLVDPYVVDNWYAPQNILVGFFDNIGTTQAEYSQAYVNLLEAFENDPDCTVVRLHSSDAAGHFTDESLDLVFIDDDHSYAGVCGSINAWLPKVRRGGILAGHDVGSRGVDRAIAELFGANVTTGADATWIHVRGE